VYEDPVDARVAARLGQPAINLLPAALFPRAGLPEAAVTIGVRPEHLRLTRGAGEGVVTRVEHLGDQDHLHLAIGGQPLVTLADPDEHLAPGERVHVDLAAPLLFGADGARVRP
jgi:multiple sugar transport system ATP-binding protein